MVRAHPTATVALSLFVALVAAACAPEPEPDAAASTTQVRDSAGVRIISYPPVEGPADTAAAAPLRRLAREGDPDHLFSNVTGLAALAGGRVAVAERDGTLRIYAADGSLDVRAGGSGEGPGEFAWLGGLQRQRGDTLVAIDTRLRRLTRFAPDGSVAGVVDGVSDVSQMPEGAGQCVAPAAQALLPDGSVLSWGWQCVRGTGRPGMRFFMGELQVTGPAGSRWSLGEHPLIEVRENPSAEDPRLAFQRPWIMGVPTLAVRDSSVLLSVAPDGYRLRAMDGRGALRWELRDATPGPMVTPEVREAVEGGVPDVLRPTMEGAPWPERRPGWDASLVAHDGTVWMRTLHIPEADPGELWTVYDPEAGTRRRLVVPPMFTLMDVREGVLWGVLRDELGVEDVVAYPVPPPAATPGSP